MFCFVESWGTRPVAPLGRAHVTRRVGCANGEGLEEGIGIGTLERVDRKMCTTFTTDLRLVEK